jgi:hypothetical protein
MEQLYGWILFTGPGVLAWQGYSWLRTGVWTALPLSKTFQYFDWPMPSTNWLGLQKMIDWVLDIPTSFAVFVVSFLIVVLLALLEATIDKRRFEREKI